MKMIYKVKLITAAQHLPPAQRRGSGAGAGGQRRGGRVEAEAEVEKHKHVVRWDDTGKVLYTHYMRFYIYTIIYIHTHYNSYTYAL